MGDDFNLSDEALQRYGRHVILPEMGEAGQVRLLQAKVLVIGAGGLGAAVLMYLTAAGVGTIGIIDHDSVEVGNLQRQIIHSNYDIGRAKVQSAEESMKDINPDCNIIAMRERLTEDNVAELIEGYDIVVDGSDNFASRYAVADACARAKIPLVSAAVVRMEGQITVLQPYLTDDPEHRPCYRCLYPQAPDMAQLARCDTVGILGPVAGLLGVLQAIETIKLITAIGDSLLGRLLLVDAFALSFYEIATKKNADCEFCGKL